MIESNHKVQSFQPLQVNTALNLRQVVHLYDTTLRDGAQRKGLSFSLDDKVKIARLLDSFGLSYIEGGWPGSNPKDMQFFRRLHKAP